MIETLYLASDQSNVDLVTKRFLIVARQFLL